MLPEVELLYLSLLDDVSLTCLAITCKKFYFAHKKSILIGRNLFDGIAQEGRVTLIPWAQRELGLILDFAFLDKARIPVLEWFLALPEKEIERFKKLHGSLKERASVWASGCTHAGHLDYAKFLYAKWNVLPNPTVIARVGQMNRAPMMSWLLEVGGKMVLRYPHDYCRTSVRAGDVESLDLCFAQGWFKSYWPICRSRVDLIQHVRTLDWLKAHEFTYSLVEINAMYERQVLTLRRDCMRWCESNGATLRRIMSEVLRVWVGPRVHEYKMEEILEEIETLFKRGNTLDALFAYPAVRSCEPRLLRLLLRLQGSFPSDPELMVAAVDSLIQGKEWEDRPYIRIKLTETDPEELLHEDILEEAAEIFELFLAQKLPLGADLMEQCVMSLFRESYYGDEDDDSSEVYVAKRSFSVVRYLLEKGMTLAPQCFDVVLERRILSLVKFLVEECECPWRAQVLDDFLSENGINDEVDLELAKYLLSLGCVCSKENQAYLEECDLFKSSYFEDE